MSSSIFVSSSDGDSGFSSTGEQVVERVIEDINRSVHLAVSSTTMSMARNKASTDLTSSNEAPDLEAKERAEREKENWSLIRGYNWSSIESKGIFLGIVVCQSYVVFCQIFSFILMKLLRKSFIFSVVELLTMFAMVMRVRLTIFFLIFMSVFLRTFMFGFLLMTSKWVFFTF